MGVVQDAIAASLADIDQIVPTPAAPFGYGTDLSCVDDLTETMENVDPGSVRSIGEALARRFSTPRGGLADDPEYGKDLRAYCNRGTPASEIRSLGGAIRSEATKDDRVSDVAVVLAPSPDGSSITVSLIVTPLGPEGPFSLVLSVTSSSVLIAEMSS